MYYRSKKVKDKTKQKIGDEENGNFRYDRRIYKRFI